MLYNLYVNQKMCETENISWKAGVIFEVLKQLANLTYTTKIMINDEVYAVLHNNFILAQIPIVPIKSRTLSTTLRELKEAGLIKSDDNNMRPAYAFTSKADLYISFNNENIKIPPVSKSKKQPLYALVKPTRVENLKPEYLKSLQVGCVDMCKKRAIPIEEYAKFIEFHSKKGSIFANWLSAFSTWCRNYKKFNPNGGESSSRGLYQ